jgi:hypothetical protein
MNRQCKNISPKPTPSIQLCLLILSRMPCWSNIKIRSRAGIRRPSCLRAEATSSTRSCDNAREDALEWDVYMCEYCMYVCVLCPCVYECVCVCVYMYVCMYVCMHVCVWVCIGQASHTWGPHHVYAREQAHACVHRASVRQQAHSVLPLKNRHHTMILWIHDNRESNIS